jgi:hypothetical protein
MRLLQINSLSPAMAKPLESSLQLQSSTSEMVSLKPMGQTGNSQHSMWIAPTTGSIIHSKRPVSNVSEQEDRDGDTNITTDCTSVFQTDHLTSESFSSDGVTTVTTSPSFGGDRMHGPQSALAKCYCHSIFATKSHAGAPRPLSILPNPTPACGHPTIDLGCTGSPKDLANSDLDVRPATSSQFPTDMRLEPLGPHPTIPSPLVAEAFPTLGQNAVNYSSEAMNSLGQEILGSGPVQLDALRGESSSEPFGAQRTDSSSWEYWTTAMLGLPEVAVASPSSKPSSVLTTESIGNPISSIRIQLYHTGERPTGIIQKQGSPASLAPPNHSNGSEGNSHTQLGSNVPSSLSRAIHDSSTISTRVDEGPPVTDTIWSMTTSATYLLTVATTTDCSSGIPTSVESSRTTSIHSDSVFDHL